MIFQEWYQILEKVQPEAEPQEKQTGGLLYRDWWLCNTKFSQVKEMGNFSWKIEVKAGFEWLSHGWRNFTYLTTKKTIGSGSFWECAKGPNERRETPEHRARGRRVRDAVRKLWECRVSDIWGVFLPPKFPGCLGLVLGPESTKMLNSWALHFKRGPVSKIKQYQEA